MMILMTNVDGNNKMLTAGSDGRSLATILTSLIMMMMMIFSDNQNHDDHNKLDDDDNGDDNVLRWDISRHQYHTDIPDYDDDDDDDDGN